MEPILAPTLTKKFGGTPICLTQLELELEQTSVGVRVGRNFAQLSWVGDDIRKNGNTAESVYESEGGEDQKRGNRFWA